MPSPRILIVEDELIVALELEERLRRQGYAIAAVARTAEQALSGVERGEVDLALLDIRLAGGRDGIELAEDLRPWDVPIVFLTAHGDEETLRRVKAVGAQGYLLKPFDERLLRLTIETALHRHASERARIAAELARRRSEAVQATILAHSPDAVLVVDDDGHIELANHAAGAIFQPRERELTGLDIATLLPEFDLEQARAEPGALLSTLGQRSDQRFPVELTVGLAPLEDGERLVLIARDVSIQRELERELARARQLEVAGRLASGVAHDLNNLLSVVSMTTYMLPDAGPDELPELVDDLNSAIELGGALTTRLLALARRSCAQAEAREVDVNEILGALERLVRRSMNPAVDVRFELSAEVGGVTIDPTRFEQIVLNLAINANRAMPEGGVLNIRSAVRTRPEDEDRAWVVVEIEDTGVGMDQSIQRRIFEPFFTTRGDAGGTGLGLSIVKEIVEGAAGFLELNSEPGRGTCFRVYFPRRGQPCEDDDAPFETHEFDGRSRRVLIVDDDELHRRIMARLLRSWGLQVVHATGAGEAMLIAERSKAALALALVDIDMPYMDGFELAGRLEQGPRELPVLLLSGSAAAEEQRTRSPILHKPVDPELLLREVSRVLEFEEEEISQC
ncbi:response regulator [Pseudenhygromyxa sp. WMMC2535]|uniref:response regulator n=1 Tax=Pseudenhygromyxa sp. WMMC2535 TaxID=2712867 RepID=UPI001551E756|nr:response regulator [Pseudenhygromyxa sp. WMMC2535]NVB36686.1 response regulator [Pseudenhygromyxa sp. WMMC2535]